MLREVILRNSNLFEFFPYLVRGYTIKKYLKNKYPFFKSAYNILDISLRTFWLLYTNRCRMGYNKDKLVLFFFQPESWDNGQTHYENLREIRGLLTVWHAFKRYKKIEQSVEKSTSRNVREKVLYIVQPSLCKYCSGLIWIRYKGPRPDGGRGKIPGRRRGKIPGRRRVKNRLNQL